MLNDDRGGAVPPASLATIWSMQYLRAVAALGVVMFHCLGDAGFEFHLGSAGIHLFFTLSGFMMWSIAGNGRIRPLPFLLGRIRRIVPMYWIATATAVASTYFVPGFFYQATRQVSNIVKSLLFIPQLGVDGGIFPVLYQGWTLQYEMYFYLLFSLCLLCPHGFRLRLLCLTFAALAGAGVILEPGSPMLHVWTDPICLEFAAGALVAHHGWRLRSPRNAMGIAILGAVTFLLSDHFEPVLRYASPLMLAATASTLIVGLLSLEDLGKIPHVRLLLLLGEASFAIYLFQDLGFALVLQITETSKPLLAISLSAFSAVATGVCIHWIVERPLNASMKRLVGRGHAVALAMSLPALVEL